jgi:hypothetical protein
MEEHICKCQILWICDNLRCVKAFNLSTPKKLKKIKIKMVNKNTTLSEQSQNLIEKS